jgi:hypothetical protein
MEITLKGKGWPKVIKEKLIKPPEKLKNGEFKPWR